MSDLKKIKLSTPEYREVVPSNGASVSLTPFKVGDEKTLLIASESKDPKQMVDAMKQIIGNNVSGMEVADMAPYDLEYLFLKLRSVSVGETATVNVECGKCKTSTPCDVDLPSVKVVKDPKHTNIIRIGDGLGFEMRWPELEDATGTTDVNELLKMIAGCIKTVYYGDETISVGAAEQADMIDILNQLTTKQFGLVQDFFETAPKLTHTADYKCEHCGYDGQTKLEGLANFF